MGWNTTLYAGGVEAVNSDGWMPRPPFTGRETYPRRCHGLTVFGIWSHGIRSPRDFRAVAWGLAVEGMIWLSLGECKPI